MQSDPAYWPAVTDVPCPRCRRGLVRWAEAGYVPGYRVCDGCGQAWFAAGDAGRPLLSPVCEVQPGCDGPAPEGEAVPAYRHTDGSYAPLSQRAYRGVRATIPAREAICAAGGHFAPDEGEARWMITFRRLPRGVVLVRVAGMGAALDGIALRLADEPPYPGEGR